MRHRAVTLGTQDTPKTLGFFLTAAERARDFDGDAGIWQVNAEVGDLRDDQRFHFSRAELFVEFLAFAHRSRAVDERSIQPRGDFIQLVEIHADDQSALARVTF